MPILLIEDDPKTALFVTEALRTDGQEVRWAATGPDGLGQARAGDWSLIIVDRMLPQLDGLTLMKQLRSEGYHGPALMLTAMGDTADKVEGLEAGADDYLSKPFAVSELSARVTALLRRGQYLDRENKSIHLRVADLELDLFARTATRSGRPIELQQQEFKLLQYLAENAGRVVTRSMLLEHVWDIRFDPRSNVVESHVSRLRSKIDRGFSQDLIQTVRGAGYTIRA